MTRTKIKSDSHGLYVRSGGYVFRPQENLQTLGYLVVKDGKTAFGVGKIVKASHLGGTPIGKIVGEGLEDVTEFWSCHGSYYDNQAKIIKSDLCFRPNQARSS